MKREIKKQIVCIYRHPLDGISVAFGTMPKKEELFRRDKKKKDFVSIGYAERLEQIRLPQPMTYKEVRDWLNKNEALKKRCESYAQG